MNKDYIGVIQAGGQGSRMKEITKNLIPKPMLRLNGKPLIQWQVENLLEYGITEFIFIVGYLGEKIKQYFGDGEDFGIHIQYIEEIEPLGSGGALYYLRDIQAEKQFIFVFADVMFHLNWDRMIGFHEQHQGQATILVHPNGHPYDSDLVVVDEDGLVKDMDFKSNKRSYWYENYVNGGICILAGDILQNVAAPEKKDLEKDILWPLMQQGMVYGYRTPEYVKDVGTPERFYNAEIEQATGIWEHKCLNRKQRCVFLDRDGTINKYKGLISKTEQFEMEEYATEAVAMLNKEGYLAIVVTNQPVVARGMCGIEDIREIHRKMQVLLGHQGAYLDDIVFCPHHPDKGYPEENPEYKIKCKCRKPGGGMIDRMVSKYNIDLKNSYMVGDSTIDIQTGVNAGIKTILVLTGQAGQDGKYQIEPDYRVANLLEAVKIIVRK